MHERTYDEAVDQLSRVSAQSGPRSVLDAIARCVPVAGGTVGTMVVQGSLRSLTSHSVNLPSDMYESWMSTPQANLVKMMTPMMRGPVGGVFTDGREITGKLREELAVIRCMRKAGFGEAAGYKVGLRQTRSGATEIVFMTLALEGGAKFGPEHHEVLKALQPAALAAVQRLQVPLLSSQSILAQILEEQTIGYACISPDGRVVEANERAYVLAHRYAGAVLATAARSCFADLAVRLREAKDPGRTVGLGLLDVSAHVLAKESHPIDEDLTLLVMKEPRWPTSLPLDSLTDRQREIALLLATTSLQYKEIAHNLAISEGTMRTHAERIYRALGVRSREELILRWRKPGLS
jgi:DNA-binding NarL/FixJ family response regulator